MSENKAEGCACSSAPKLIFSCSGAADVGALADQTARRLSKEGAGKMYCLTGVGGRVPNILTNVQAAGKLLAIDGCPLNCARRTLEEAGFKEMAHLELGTAGFPKGQSPASEENIQKAVELAKPMLAC
jgi:uncharacterized metal-binding protein